MVRLWMQSLGLYLLFAATSSAFITSSNTSTASDWFSGTLPLQHAEGDSTQIAQLIPLTREATSRTIEGNLYNTNFSNIAGIANGDVAYISCDEDDHTGLVDAQRVFTAAYENANISGIILYSTTVDYCDYDQETSQDIMQGFPVLSMVNKQDSGTLRNAIANLPISKKYFVRVQSQKSKDNSNNQQTQQNPLGPSPSTAVAMIILYSITGIITALFLVIIITGAIRAHRHPERYGPRNVLGRPRQSRARGLARAMLDTIPIVKFGDKEPAKPTDVELASASETRDVAVVGADTGSQPPCIATAGAEAIGSAPKSDSDEIQTSPNVAKTQAEDHQEGIAPAQSTLAGAATGTDHASHDENLGCSICTEDFENGQDLRVLPCDHKFHPECVDPWLLNVSGTCPLCRVDLHPVSSHNSSPGEHTQDLELDPSHRRRSAFRNILSLRHRPNASPEERILALRRLFHEEGPEYSASYTAQSGADTSTSDGATATTRDRRSKRMSSRISQALHGRSMAGRDEPDDPGNSGESSSTQRPRNEQHNDGSRS